MTILILKRFLEQLIIIRIILNNVIIKGINDVIINIIVKAILFFNKNLIYLFNMSSVLVKKNKLLYGVYL